MPKKAIFTKDHILNKAFEMLEKKGLEEITARNLAKVLKSSPAPIYGFFKSMDDLKKELIDRSKDVFMEYVKSEKIDIPLLGIGMGIVIFAREEKQLFRSIFLRENSYKGLIQEFRELIEKEMDHDKRFDRLPKDIKENLFLDCWTYAHGLATLVSTDYFEDPSNDFIRERLMSGAATVLYKRLEEVSK